MLMGAVCTRACKFCAVDTGNPAGWLDPDEPAYPYALSQVLPRLDGGRAAQESQAGNQDGRDAARHRGHLQKRPDPVGPA